MTFATRPPDAATPRIVRAHVDSARFLALLIAVSFFGATACLDGAKTDWDEIASGPPPNETGEIVDVASVVSEEESVSDAPPADRLPSATDSETTKQNGISARRPERRKSSGGSDVRARATRVIGPQGGTLELGGAKVVVPARALREDTRVVLTELKTGAPDGFDGLSSVYEIGPVGIELARPLELSITAIVDPTHASLVLLSNDGAPPETTTGLVSGRVLTAQTPRFGRSFVGVRKGNFFISTRGPAEELGCTEGHTRPCEGRTQRCAFRGVQRCVAAAWSTCSGCCEYERSVTRPRSTQRTVCRQTPQGELCHTAPGEALGTRVEKTRDCQ